VQNAREHFAAAENVHKGCPEILYILYVQLCREFCRNGPIEILRTFDS
jgi:hypothetical protein